MHSLLPSALEHHVRVMSQLDAAGGRWDASGVSRCATPHLPYFTFYLPLSPRGRHPEATIGFQRSDAPQGGWAEGWVELYSIMNYMYLYTHLNNSRPAVLVT